MPGICGISGTEPARSYPSADSGGPPRSSAWKWYERGGRRLLPVGQGILELGSPGRAERRVRGQTDVVGLTEILEFPLGPVDAHFDLEED